MIRPREYLLRRNAERRMAALQAQFPGREFWIAPTQSFRFAVYTRREAATDAPNAIAMPCG